MDKPYKAVIIGAAHMHVLYLAQDCLDNPRMQLCGMADTAPLVKEFDGVVPFTRPWNWDYVTKRLGVPAFDDYIKMLDEVKPDLALLTCETPLHGEVFAECARRGIAVSMEKPMAVNLAEGLAMARTAQQTGATLMVNWPLAWQPYMTQYKEILDSGKLGRLLKVRQLVGHPGPLGRGVRHPRVDETSDKVTGWEKAGTWWHTAAAGGGAMLDFCCYGAMSCNWLVGQKAQAAMGMRCNTNSHWADADDNATMVVRYPGVMAVLEGSWTVPVSAPAPGPTLTCEEGVVSCEARGEGVVVKCLDMFGNVTELEPAPPKPHLKNVTTAFVHHKKTGQPLPLFLDLDQNLEVLAILDAGVRSAASGKLEVVDNITWRIG